MTDDSRQPNRQPPPLPRRPDEVAAPLPVPVVPVELGYARPGTVKVGRTWLIPVTGIACLVVAAESLLFALFTSSSAFELHASAVPPAGALPPAPLPAPELSPHSGDVFRDGGLRRGDRAAIVAAVVRRAPRLSADRRVMLDWILREVGADALGVPHGTTGLSPADADAKVLAVTQLPAGPDGARGLGTHVVRTPAGSISLNNHAATFSGADGRRAHILWHGFTDYAGKVKWSSARIEQALDEAQAVAASKPPRAASFGSPGVGPMNAMQAATLVAEMQKSSPPLGEHDSAIGARPMEGFTRLEGDTISATLQGRGAWVLTNGAIAYPPTDRRYEWDPATGRKKWTPPAQLNWIPASRWATAYVVADIFLSAGLAMLLAVLGVCLLFDVRRSRRFLLAYASLKLVAAVALAAVMFWILRDIARALSPPGAAALNRAWATPGPLAGRVLLVLFVQSLFPVALLVILSTTAVRNHFRSLGEPALLPAAVHRAASRFARGRVGRAAFLVAAVVGATVAVAQIVLAVDEFRQPVAGVNPAANVLAACAAAAIAVLGWGFSRRDTADEDAGLVELQLVKGDAQ